MIFDVEANAYDRFMGRFSTRLAAPFAEWAGVRAGLSAIDVGCGPGALTAHLVELLGHAAVSAADPSETFVAAARERMPGVDVRLAPAERLPFADGAADVVLAQLVVPFLTDREAGMREMRRVARPGGTVAACVWDHAGGRGPLSPFWQGVRELWPDAPESTQPGTRRHLLAELAAKAGLVGIESGELTVVAPMGSFEEWWEPYTLGVGPAGVWLARLTPDDRERLRARCAASLPEGPFPVAATAWTMRARAPS